MIDCMPIGGMKVATLARLPACVVWRAAGTHKLLVKFAIAWRDVSGMTDSIATRAYIPIKRALRRKV